jgi:hypothetical protein
MSAETAAAAGMEVGVTFGQLLVVGLLIYAGYKLISGGTRSNIARTMQS